jgi:hypothetical protein
VDEGQKIGRRLSFLDSEATEGEDEEEEEEEDIICSC